MTALDDYLGRVRGLLISLADRLTPEECAEVEHLIAHGEPAEGLRTLAWIIVDERKTIPAEAMASLRELTAGMIEVDHMPPGLDRHVDPS